MGQISRVLVCRAWAEDLAVPLPKKGKTMKLYTAHRAPSPRRVLMFLIEKNITGIEMVNMDLNGGEHRTPRLRWAAWA